MFYEVILLDKDEPTIIRSTLQEHNKAEGRAFRGLTSIGKKAQGNMRKRFGAHKIRPSQNRYMNAS